MNKQYKVKPWYTDPKVANLSAQDVQDMLNFSVECGANGVEGVSRTECTYVKVNTYGLSICKYWGLTNDLYTHTTDPDWRGVIDKTINKVSSLQELKDLFSEGIEQETEEKEGLVAEHKDITQDTSIVNMIVVGNNIYERGRLYFNEHGEIVLLIGNIHNCFVVHHPTTNQVLPNCKNLYEIKSELGKVTTSVELIDNVFYKVTYGSGLTKVLSYIADYGFISEYDGSNYQDLYKDFKVICKMTEA